MDFASSTRAAENRTSWKGTLANSGAPTTFQGFWDRTEKKWKVIA